MAEVRVAMVGTCDAANFGDVLFPVLAECELQARLGEVTITAYGYRALSSSHWPYPVRSVGDLPGEIADYDLLLIGGGLLVRHDPRIAPGYAPSDPRVHEPLGLWLVPALAAHAAGVPVVWNAVGAWGDLPAWLEPLAGPALAASAHLAARDDASAAVLIRLAPGARVQVVPDTAFGAACIVDDTSRAAAGELLAEAGLAPGSGYVLVQATTGLSAVREPIEAALRTARDDGLAVVEVPFGPILGDADGAFPMPGKILRLSRWPDPATFCAIIAGAELVIHQSLHAGVAAFANGVPSLRRPMPAGKHDQLSGLPGIHVLGEASLAMVEADATAAKTARDAILARLARHWDDIAALATAGNRRPQPALTDLLASLPTLLDALAAKSAEAAERELLAAETAAAYRAFSDRDEERDVEQRALIAEVDRLRRTLAERDEALTAQATAHEEEVAHLHALDEDLLRELKVDLVRLHQRDATLERVLTGGWWRLRDRLSPLLRVAALLRRWP